jgi:predicted transposase YdaD
MHAYDVALKRILTRPGSALLRLLAGADGDEATEIRWLNVELPKVNNLRVDLLGAWPDGGLIQFEFQSRNEKGLAFRMAEYKFAVHRRYGQLPRQVVLYVGEKPLRMRSSIRDPDLRYRFHLRDVRELDGEALLASGNLSDNVIAVLTRLGEEPGTVRRVLAKVAEGPAAQRREALSELSVLAGLRRLNGELKRESEKMPIRENIMDNPYVGPIIRQAVAEGIEKAMAEGREKGLAEGKAEGKAQGQVEILLRQIEKKFGAVSGRARKRISSLPPAELEAASLRLLDAEKIGDLFG